MSAEEVSPINRRGCTTAIKWVFGVLLILTVATLCLPTRTEYGHPIEMKSRVMLKDIQVALKSFHIEYERWPLYLEELNAEVPVETQGSIVESLVAEVGRFSSKDNPRAIRFLDLPMARNGKGGLMETVDGVRALVDVWGTRYVLVVDVDGDNQVPNPEAAAPEKMRFDKNAPKELAESVIVYSAGPDRNPDTWKDNIVSWRD